MKLDHNKIIVDVTHQVTAVAVCGSEVYVGTTWGCVVVAEAESMRPITVFRPYENEVRAIVPLPPASVVLDPGSSDDQTDGFGGDREGVPSPTPLLATIGKGYRNLLGRYAPMPRSAHPEPAQAQRAMYCLLWRAHHWLNT